MKKNYLLLILLGILLTMGLNLFSLMNFQYVIKLTDMRRELFFAKENVINLLSDLKDVEIGQRGYIITGNNDYLEPYYQALFNIPARLEQIKRNQFYFFPQNISVEELLQLVELKLDKGEKYIELRHEKGFKEAQTDMIDGEGKPLMDEIRSMINQVLNHYEQQFQDISYHIFYFTRISWWLTILSGSLASLLMCLYSYFFYRDNLQLRQVSQQLKQTSDLYKVILNSMTQMIITTDKAGVMTSFNKAAEKILGYKASEVVGKQFITYLFDYQKNVKNPENLEQKVKTEQKYQTEFEALMAIIRDRNWSETECVMQKKNGDLFPCFQSITTLHSEANDIQGYLFMGLDVSEHKKWRHEVQDAKRAIEETQLAKNHLLVSLNDELRTPLNSIMNLSTLLMKNIGGNLKDQEIAQATRISDHCQSMLNVINEIFTTQKEIDLPKSKENKPSEKFSITVPTEVKNFFISVLIIDNDSDFCAILADYFKNLGCQVTRAANGEEALRLAKMQTFDLITMDMLMSPMNGYDIVQHLQSDPNLRNIPYAFISVIAKEIRGKIPGALAFINKPINQEELISLLQKVQAKHRSF